MLRGRRVLFVCLFTILIFLSFNNKTLAVEERNFMITATVSPSIDWQKSIAKESQIKIESQSIEINRPIKISIYNRGLNQSPLANQDVLITVVYEGKIIDRQKLASNNKGVAGFAFVPTVYGDYQFKFENVTYDIPIVLEGQISFELYPSPITSLTSLLVGLLTFKR